jgi:hypothetical protein
MEGKCALYDIETQLRESHLYPKFVINYLKDSGSTYFRNYIVPNKRLQDGPKKYLLSEQAEQDFSLKEKWFAENIFRAYTDDDQKSFNYDENLYYFTASFLWRVLLFNINHPNIVSKPYINLLKEAAEEWKLFLIDSIYPSNFNRFYLFFSGRLKSHNLNVENVDYYLSRALDSTIVSTPDNKFIAVYGKFTRFIFWGVLKGGDESKLKDLKIDPIKGIMNIPQKFEEQTMGGFFKNRIEEIAALPKPSENQQEKIMEEILKDKEGFLKSDLGESITNDKFNLGNKSSD